VAFKNLAPPSARCGCRAGVQVVARRDHEPGPGTSPEGTRPGGTSRWEYGTFEIGDAPPAPSLALWMRTAAGTRRENGRIPFANFYFGRVREQPAGLPGAQAYRDYAAFPVLRWTRSLGRVSPRPCWT